MSLTAEELSVFLDGKLIWEHLCCQLPEQGLVFLLGPNGSGKSTLLRALCGLQKVSSGRIMLNGQELGRFSVRERARQISYLPQRIDAGEMTVLEYVLLGAAPWLNWAQTPGKKWIQQAKQLLEELGLEHLSQRSFTQISGGERQLAAVAMALFQNTPIMLLDEPTANLDVLKQQEFLRFLSRVAKQKRKCVLLSVHDPNLALQYGNGALVFQKQGLCQLHQSETFGQQLWKALVPLYGSNLILSREGYFYWKQEGGCDSCLQHSNL